MNGNPKLVNGFHQGSFGFVGDEPGSVPSCASVQHVEDDVLLNEEKITLNLFVEFVGDLDTTRMVWPRLSPCAANLTSLNRFRNKVQNSLWYADSVQELCHYAGRSVPPAYVQFPQRQTYCPWLVCSEQANNTANVEVRPIAWSFRVVALITKDSSYTLFLVGSSPGPFPGFNRTVFPRGTCTTNLRERASCSSSFSVSFGYSFFTSLPEFLAICVDWCSHCGVFVCWWLWFVWLASFAFTTCSHRGSSPPTFVMFVGVVFVESGCSPLACGALRYPRVVVWIGTLSYYTVVFPVVPCSEVFAPGASRILGWLSPGITAR